MLQLLKLFFTLLLMTFAEIVHYICGTVRIVRCILAILIDI